VRAKGQLRHLDVKRSLPPSKKYSTEMPGGDRSKGCGIAEEKQGYFRGENLKGLLLLANWECGFFSSYRKAS
jgi:hypothetical protein